MYVSNAYQTGQQVCQEYPSAKGRGMVLESTLAWFSSILSVQTLTEIVLSPHDRFMAGLLPGNYSTTNIPATATFSCIGEGGQGLVWQTIKPSAACPGPPQAGVRMELEP